MRSIKSTITKMLQKNPGLTKLFPHFVDGLHTVYPAKDGKPAFWVPTAKRATNEEASTVRQSDRSSRDAISDKNDETEQKDTENDGDNWDEEAEIDDELQLDIGGGRQTTRVVRVGQKEDIHGLSTSVKEPKVQPKQTLQQSHPHFFPKP